MCERKKIIVYGLGKEFRLTERYLKSKFDIIGYCDKKIVGGIRLENIPKLKYDYIYISSSKYFQEIKENIIKIIGIRNEDKIISLCDVFGDFRNYEIRDQWVIDKLKKIPKGKVLLDAGAGEQRYKSYCTHLEYIAQDFGEYVPNIVKNGLHKDSWAYTGLNITCDIIDMPLKNESIDVILCTEVFEHLKNPILALKEFSRVMKKDGVLILTAPFCCLTHMAPYFYYNGFSEYWYKEHLEDYGFTIIEFVRNGNFFKYLCQELFRVENMAKRYCNYELESEETETILKSVEILMGLSEKDCDSNETLCFGNMVLARKNF